jgi:MYXO-CTERM domain-containing protein
MRVVLAAIVGCLFLATASPARAADEREELMQKLTQEYDALSTSDCTSACRALASMERAATRLCALDAGKACDDARAKVEDARRRVRAACPMCVTESPKGSSAEPPPPPAPTPVATQTHAEAAGPPAESKRGGCAGCATAPMDAGDVGVAALAGLGLLLVRRRRRR